MFCLFVIVVPQYNTVAQGTVRHVRVQVIIGTVRIIRNIDVRLAIIDRIIGLIRVDGSIASRNECRVHWRSRYACVCFVVYSRSSRVLNLACSYLAGDNPHTEPGNAVRSQLVVIGIARFWKKVCSEQNPGKQVCRYLIPRDDRCLDEDVVVWRFGYFFFRDAGKPRVIGRVVFSGIQKVIRCGSFIALYEQSFFILSRLEVSESVVIKNFFRVVFIFERARHFRHFLYASVSRSP